MSEILKKIASEEGCEIHVVKISGGYSVSIFDCEAQAYAPVLRIYKTLEDAIKYAEQA